MLRSRGGRTQIAQLVLTGTQVDDDATSQSRLRCCSTLTGLEGVDASLNDASLPPRARVHRPAAAVLSVSCVASHSLQRPVHRQRHQVLQPAVLLLVCSLVCLVFNGTFNTSSQAISCHRTMKYITWDLGQHRCKKRSY